ncbi:hypothetical protein AVEN_140382-1 [Araneus ventricosus]|uniref:Uncharacterized protein n=1 Tax=Araneus ventricosus TaxID=182803 RepID=A0A4Y2L484_ARAVE|nr:hypothetical protein AVEN_140382-1 [Araneus ventricosus]
MKSGLNPNHSKIRKYAMSYPLQKILKRSKKEIFKHSLVHKSGLKSILCRQEKSRFQDRRVKIRLHRKSIMYARLVQVKSFGIRNPSSDMVFEFGRGMMAQGSCLSFHHDLRDT